MNSDSALDLHDYESDHNYDDATRRATYAAYEAAMEKHNVRSGACLEIGSGTGFLTYSLARYAGFSEINCSDLSHRFLGRLRERLNNSPKLKYWMFDAGSLPFKDGSMDAVFGHSVLHHLLHYERAIEDVYRVLRPGGLAMFGDPIMDSQALTAFCAGLILRLEHQTKAANLTEMELGILEAVRIQCPSIGRKMRDSREELADIEDKHMFVVSDMLTLCRDVGFSVCEYENAYDPPSIGDDHRFCLNQIMTRFGMPEDKLKPYDFIFNELSETYGAAMGKSASYNFGYFILKK